MHPLALNDLPVPAVIASSDGRVIAANGPATRLFVTPALAGKLLENLFGADDAATLLNGEYGPLRVEGRRATGTPVVLDASAVPTTDDPSRLLVVLHEITFDRLKSESNRYFDVAFETAPIGMALFSADGEYIRVNDALCALLGRDADELIGTRDQDLTHPDDRQADIDAAYRILRGEIQTHQAEKRFIRPDGSIVWAIANLTFLRDIDGRALTWVGQFQDVTERHEQAHQLRHLADHDLLTDVLNRRGFEAELERVAQSATDEGVPGALLLLDLDGFKPINDAHGHGAGDRVLCGVADRLRLLRATDIVGRIGGDEFAVLLPRTRRPEAEAVARRLVDSIAALDFGDELDGVRVEISVGVAALGPGQPVCAKTLIGAADEAMYRAKQTRSGVALAAA